MKGTRCRPRRPERSGSSRVRWFRCPHPGCGPGSCESSEVRPQPERTATTGLGGVRGSIEGTLRCLAEEPPVDLPPWAVPNEEASFQLQELARLWLRRFHIPCRISLSIRFESEGLVKSD